MIFPAIKEWLALLTLLFAAFGYQALAPLFQYVDSESSSPSIFMRAGVAFLAATLISLSLAQRQRWFLYMPAIVFMSAFTARLIENYYIRELELYIEASRMFPLWIGGAILPSMALAAYGRFFETSKYVVGMLSLSILFVGFLIPQLSEIYSSGVSRASLQKLNPIGLAYIAIVFGFFFGIRYFYSSRILVRILSVGGLISMIALAVWSGSRGPLVAAVFTLITYVLLVKGQRRSRIIGGGFVIAVVASLAPLFFDFNFLQPVLSRMGEIFENSGDAATSSVAARTIAWQASIEQIREHPILGDVIFERALNYYPHQMFLESMISVGLLGTFFLAGHVVVLIYATIKILNQKKLSEAEVYLVMVCWCAFYAAQFSSSITTAFGFWPLSFMIISRSLQIRKNGRSINSLDQFQVGRRQLGTLSQHRSV